MNYEEEEEEHLSLIKGEKDRWDIFMEIPHVAKKGSMQETAFIDFGEKVIKLASYIITFCVVLGCAILSKASLLFMTSQIKSNVTKPYCNREFGTYQQFVVTLPTEERVAWIWIIFFAYCIPQFGILIRSLRMYFFKKWIPPTLEDFLIVFITETLPAIGSGILVFAILPDLDVIKGAMLTNAMCFIPAVLSFFNRGIRCATTFNLSLDVLSILAQASAFAIWPMIEEDTSLWLIPVSVILISFGWWENFITTDAPIKLLQDYAKRNNNVMKNNRYFVYIFASLWKCLCFFLTMLVIIHIKEDGTAHLFNKFNSAFAAHKIEIIEIEPIINTINVPNISDIIVIGNPKQIITDKLTPLYFLLINVLTTYCCYIFGKFACKVYIQGFSYALPINLTIPATLSLLIAMSGTYMRDVCYYAGTIPSYLFFNLPPIYFLKDFISQEFAWIWLIWLLSQTWVTMHIWKPNTERLAKTEKLYLRPMYDAFLIDQDIAMNRRKIDNFEKANEEEQQNKTANDDEADDESRKYDLEKEENPYTKKIYACATMWHEEREEMMMFLQSIMQLDNAQFNLKQQKEEEGFCNDYFDLETHIFFDDSFETKVITPATETSEQRSEKHLNSYVCTLIECVNEAVKKKTLGKMQIGKPTTYKTPYGGRIKWILPGGTKMIAHLKDNKLIRNKKRWSQVMYMYYLLGFKLAAADNLKPDEITLKAEKTYILALDGDIDFQPKAVLLLVDLMVKNEDVGAACGRIHPVGSGPMVWYQMFEYAIGHWLQKATEHMIGCVLCSPGCFSLFRGSALMQANVMKKYTTMAIEPMDHVQYDQGEDRWLCTLLLQQGLRVEYSAASDAYTHCPETFNEFYNQRRRWMPSTTANIFDLLIDYKNIIKVNNSISRLYILYQIVLMIGTVLGPGTIFLMLVGAFVAAFQMDQWNSFIWNLVPILAFIFACRIFKKDTVQLSIAAIISAIYGLIMMAVLVGVLLQISNDGWLAPSSLFFFCVAGEMIVTAMLHPKELNCLVYGVVYYVTVPSMYLLLVIYSVFNMNNVSWGTRETAVKKDDNAADVVNTATGAAAPSRNINIFSRGGDNSGSVQLSFGGLFKCLLCTHKSEETYQLKEIKSNINLIMKKLDIISEKQVQQTQQQQQAADDMKDKPNILHGASIINNDYTNESPEEMWMDEDPIRNTEKANISSTEEDFWVKLIERYLYPVVLTDDEKDKLSQGLAVLRDRVVAAFLIINSLFVLVVFLLTLKKDLIHIKWPLDVKTNFTYRRFEDDHTSEIRMTKEYLQLEPIGFVFLIFFGVLLVVQFVAMVLHRFATMCHILANTELTWTKDELADATIEDDVELCMKEKKEKGNAADVRRKTLANFITEDQVEVTHTTYAEFYKHNPRKTKFASRMSRRNTTMTPARTSNAAVTFEGF